MDWWEIFTLLTGLAYVILEIRQKNAMWVLGIMTAFASMIVFFRQGLYAFFGLQVYYFLISFWGFYRWGKDRRALEKAESRSGAAEVIRINRLTRPVLFLSILLGAAAFAGTGLLMQSLDDPMPWLDSAVTVLGAVATWWLGRSHAEQWWLLIVANILTVIMFALQGSWWMTVLYVIYVAASVYGLVHWRKCGVYLEEV